MNLNRYRNNKGNMVLDSVVVLIALVAFGIISLYAAGLMSDVTEVVTDDPEFGEHSGDANASALVTNLDNRMPNTLDSAFGLALGLLWIFVVVSAFMLDSRPAFFIISLVLFVGVLLAAGFLTEAYGDLAVDDSLSSEVEQFPITHFVLDNLIIIILIVGFSIGVALYAKSR